MTCKYGREPDINLCDPYCDGTFCNAHFKRCPICNHWYDDNEFTYDCELEFDICDGCAEDLEDERKGK